MDALQVALVASMQFRVTVILHKALRGMGTSYIIILLPWFMPYGESQPTGHAMGPLDQTGSSLDLLKSIQNYF